MAITANDEPTEIEADVDKRFSSIVVNLPVQQTGTGTPSPTNPRPFTVWTDVSLYVSDTEEADEPTLSIQLPTPLYGGKIDMVRGEIATTYNSKESGTGWEMTQEGQFRCQVSAYNNGDETSTNVADLYAVHYETVSNKDAYDDTDDLTCGLATIDGTTYLYVNDAQYTTLESFATHIAEEVFVFRAHIPMSDVTEPHIVYLPEGTSYVWADAGFVDYTVSGTPPISLPNSLGKPLKAWSVDLLPYQEGTGDPSPDNVRPIHGTDKLTITTAGKNLLPQATSQSYSDAGLTILKNADGTLLLSGTSSSSKSFTFVNFVLGAGTYTFSGGNEFTASNGVLFYIRNLDAATTLATVTNAARSSSFTLSSTTNVRFYVVVSNSGLEWSGTFKPQLEFGSTATPYTPYLAPSQTVITIPTLSANQWDEEWIRCTYNDNTGAVTPSTSSTMIGSKNYIRVIPDATYAIARPVVNVYAYFYDYEKNFLPSYVRALSATFTIPHDAMYMKFYTGSAYGYVYNHNISINYPSSVTTYNPYNATVYNGTVGSEGGESRWASAMFDGSADEGWTISGTGTYVAKCPTAKQNTVPISSIYPMESTITSEYNIRPIGNNADFASVAEWKAYLAEHPMQVVYELATPTTFSVPSVTIPTPTGSATTWATAEDGTVDSMEVTYVGKPT